MLQVISNLKGNAHACCLVIRAVILYARLRLFNSFLLHGFLRQSKKTVPLYQ
jgi:hypothetical protein